MIDLERDTSDRQVKPIYRDEARAIDLIWIFPGRKRREKNPMNDDTFLLNNLGSIFPRTIDDDR